jgi:tryptophan-rich sensory protein
MIIVACFAALWAIVVAGAGGALTQLGAWYYALRKPSWQPPDWAFGPAWSVILVLAAIAAALAWRHATNGAQRAEVLGLFAVNGVFNIAWSLLFFRLQRPDWALLEVPLLWLSILAPMLALGVFSRSATWLLLPYLLWVSFAAYLNLTIVRLNAPFQEG